MNITVYLGVNEGNDTTFKTAVRELGAWIGGRGHALVYCGWTNDLEKRITAHNAGMGAKYTKPRRPVELAYYETFATKQEAMLREAEIKRLTRREKMALICLAYRQTPEK